MEKAKTYVFVYIVLYFSNAVVALFAIRFEQILCVVLGSLMSFTSPADKLPIT